MADTFDATVNSEEGWSYVKYDGSIDLTGNLEDAHYTQAFLIAEANNTNAGFISTASGGGGTNGDVIVSLQVSNDRETWETVSTALADHDATVTIDALLGDTNYEQFKAYKWARLEAEGQASNDYTTIDWSAVLTKNNDQVPSDGGSQVENRIS